MINRDRPKFLLTCTECLRRYMARAGSHKDRMHCHECHQKYRILQGRVCNKVGRAIRSGKLPHPSTLECVDCAKVRPPRQRKKYAEVYDHRNYDRPLEVEPVCKSHNARRGHARWTSGVERPVVVPPIPPTFYAPECAAITLLAAA